MDAGKSRYNQGMTLFSQLMFRLCRSMTSLFCVMISAALCWRYGSGTGFGYFAIGLAIAAVIAATLLQSTRTGQITWRNRVARLFFQGGFEFSGGALIPLTIFNIFVFGVWGVVGLLLTMRWKALPDDVLYPPLLEIVIFLGWFLTLIVSSWLINRKQWKFVILTTLLLLVSAVAYRNEYFWVCVLVIYTPFLLILLASGPMLLLLVSMLIAKLRGQKIHWN